MKTLYKRAFALATIFVLLALVGSTLAQGRVLADSGFRPQTHGFSFANYGNENKPVNLTPASMRQILGDRVCKAIQNNECVLTATAQAWMDKQNADMNGGHCEGMAALSKLIFTGQVKLADLDPNARTVADLKADNPRVQAEIAKWWATQATPPTATQEIRNQTPSQVVDTLIAQLQPNSGPFTMGIYKAGGGGGHAITPYSVVDMGNGVVRIMVYDNNYPNEERFIEVDRNTNTWKYTGSTNPNEPPSEYSGKADSFNLTLTPTAARIQLPQQCPFCTPTDGGIGAQVAAAPTVEGEAPRAARSSCGQTFITTGAETDLVVTTADGGQVGFVRGQAFSNVEGATILQPRTQSGLADDTAGAIIAIPTAGGELSVTVNTPTGQSEVMVYSCGGYQQVSGLSQADGQPDTLTFDAGTSYITFELEAGEVVRVAGGLDNLTGDDFSYLIPALSGDETSILSVGINPEEHTFALESNKTLNFDAELTTLTLQGESSTNTIQGVSSTVGQGVNVQSSPNTEPVVEQTTIDSAVFETFETIQQAEQASFEEIIITIEEENPPTEDGSDG